ncbi:hypothetical protein AB0P36_10620 [Streptomyces flavidovirens]|uniref:hypothetical protein n=1 Tax=Streptomyces flavidovirens TaxID=67298 RepID=UPI003439CB64
MTENAPLDDLLQPCRAALRDFTPASNDPHSLVYAGEEAKRFSIERSLLPVPGSVRLVLLLALEAHDLGRADKVAWEIPFTFRGKLCSIALQKFGMRLYIARQDGEEPLESTAREIIGKLSAATRCIENRVLSKIAMEHVAAGHVTIHNQSSRLRSMYKFFRRLAERAYAGDGILMKDLDTPSASGSTPLGEEIARALQREFGAPLARDSEGFFATISMINAYFSLLEHLLVLALPATDFDPTHESITRFIGNKVFEKYDRVFDIKGDPQAKRFRTRLHGAAEVWRNPYGHGAFDKQHGTLYFQVPNVGPLPTILSDIRTHPTFHFVPSRETAFDDMCSLFDELDEWLRTGPIRYGIMWVESGFSVSYDPVSLGRFRSAVKAGEGAFTDLLDTTAYQEDQAANMDW